MNKETYIHPLIENINNGEINLKSIFDNEMHDRIIDAFDTLSEYVSYRFHLTKDVPKIVSDSLKFYIIFDMEDVTEYCKELAKGSIKLLFVGNEPSTQKMFDIYKELDSIKDDLGTLILTNEEKRSQYTLNL